MRSLQTWRFCDSRVGKTRLTHVESVIIERCQAAYNSALSGSECVQQESSRGERRAWRLRERTCGRWVSECLEEGGAGGRRKGGHSLQGNYDTSKSREVQIKFVFSS